MKVTKDVKTALPIVDFSCPPLWRGWDRLAERFPPAFLWRERGGQDVWLALGARARFSSIEECREALRKLPVSADYPARAFGVLAFDPRAELSSPWEGFKSRLFVLPETLISWRDGLATVLSLSGSVHAALAETLQNPPPLAMPQVVDGGRTFSRTGWDNAIHTIQGQIASGAVSKVVLARDTIREASSSISAGFVLEQLAASARDCYLFAHGLKGATFLGATPERLFELRANERLYTESLAGTRPRGRNAEEDQSLADELLGSVKERSEQEYVTGFLRQAVAKLCRQLHWSEVPEVRKLASVQHLYAHVGGELHAGVTFDDVLKGLHPTPAVCGTPRDVTREMIAELEPVPRGLYAGAIGWIEAENAEFAVGIRSAVLRHRFAHVFAGAGIVEQSDAKAEWMETALKMKPMLAALGCTTV